MRVALIQSAFFEDPNENFHQMVKNLGEAKKQDAHVIVPPELFLYPYFCKTQNEQWFSRARAINDDEFVGELQKICKSYQVVFPYSFFEKEGPNYYNSVAMIDATGDICGIYRKSHIPDGPGYQEKYYFRPGNSGFKVFNTAYGAIGCGICWDQWFPEAARIMVLKGADLLIYPTAIGSEPHAPGLDTKDLWRRVMAGHAVANMVPIAAANRIGNEDGQEFYGASFVCNEFGEPLLTFEKEAGVKVVEVDIDKAQKNRASFGFFRDRRKSLYGAIVE